MAGITAAPVNFPIVWNVGTTLSIQGTVTDTNSSLYDFTNATITTSITTQAGAAAIVSSFTTSTPSPTNGVFILSLTTTQLASLLSVANTYLYSVAVARSGVATEWLAGSFTIQTATTGGTATASAFTLTLTTSSITLALSGVTQGTAANITVTDAGGYFPTTPKTAETALQDAGRAAVASRWLNSAPLSATTATVSIVPTGTQTLLTIPTYDGSNVCVHPSLVYMERGWNGYRYWLAFTPYPSANSAFENPSIVVSNDGITWTVPAGGSNPIEPKPATGSNDFNSDPYLTMARDGYMYLFWRSSLPSQVGAEEVIYYRRSSDGITWSTKVAILTNNQATRRLVAPSVIEEADGTWRMFAVDLVPSPNTFVTLTASTLTGTWSAPTICSGVTVGTGRDPWHGDVRRIGGEYVLLINDSTLDSSTTGSLFRAISRDGSTFTTDTMCFPPMVVSSKSQYAYKSTFALASVNGALGYEVVWGDLTQFCRGFVTVAPDYRWQDDISRITAAAANIPPYVAGDVVNRADSATVPGTATSGLAWTVSTGTIGVQSKALYAPNATNTRGVLAAGIADGEFGFTFKVAPTGSEQAYLVFRFQDASNYWRVGKVTSTLELQTVVAGSVSTIMSFTGPSPANGTTPQLANGDRIKAVCVGSSISIYINDRLVAQTTNATFASATSFGFQTNTNGAARFTNFYAKTP